MRIIAGEKKGIVLETPGGLDTRPTLSRVRESLFNILGHSVIDAKVWDLYAGSGSLGLEALSRGAQSCLFVESGAEAATILRKNIAKLKFQDTASVRAMDAERWVKSIVEAEMPTLILADPPYGKNYGQSLLNCLSQLPLPEEAIIVIQTQSSHQLDAQTGSLISKRIAQYGATQLHFYGC